MSFEAKNLAVVYLAGPREWDHSVGSKTWSKLECLHASLTLLRRFAPPFPVIVFHEDLLPTDMTWLEEAGGAGVDFQRVSFSGHEGVYVNAARYGDRVDSYGYRMMCRFFCGVMQNHPALAGFDRYMRMDDDSYLLAPLSDQVIAGIMGHDYTYASMCDDPRPDIGDAAREFAAGHGLVVPPHPKARVPYNNYHTSSLRLWHNPLVQEFMSHAGERCLTDCWNDAPVHKELIEVFCPSLGFSVHYEKNLPYRHNQHCCHPGPHTTLCRDGTPGPYYWGPPEL